MEEHKTNMIEVPEHMKAGLPTRELGNVAFGAVNADVNTDVSRSYSEGRFITPPVVVEKTNGIPIEFPGHDTFMNQARTAGSTVGNVERPTEIDPEEV